MVADNKHFQDSSPLKPCTRNRAVRLVCPFCGLACDDLSPPRDTAGAPFAHDCPVAIEGYQAAIQAPLDLQPRLHGKPVALDEALDHAADRLRQSRLPLFAGMIGDLPESRALWRLADRCGATVDHAGGDALSRMYSVAQMQGLMTTTLGEARNRADLWLFIGDGIFRRQPRISERLLSPKQRLHTGAKSSVVVLGSGSRSNMLPDQVEYVDLDSCSIADFVGSVRATLQGWELGAAAHPKTQDVAAQVQQAQYPVVAMDPADLSGSRSDGLLDLDLLGVARLIRQINETGRAALLPMGARDGLSSCQQAGLWHNGFGLRTGHNYNGPHFDPHGHDTARMLQEGGADLLLWHASLRPIAPPETGLPSLVFGHPGLTFIQEPELFVPLSVPGIHRTGQIHRGDGITVLPLPALLACTESDLTAGPGVYADLLARIMEESAGC